MQWILIGLIVILVAVCAVLALALIRRGAQTHNEAGTVRDELRMSRQEAATQAHQLREEVATRQKGSAETLVQTLGEMGKLQQNQLETVTLRLNELTKSNDDRLEKLRQTLEMQLKQLREGNEKRLEEMRKTVDEKLQGTLEKRLAESFKLVQERLEAVQLGLGEMKSLATGVGDLKRVLTNVKARGTWGEVQLGALLEQVLTPDQYAKNVVTREGSREHVEFAIRLPGPSQNPDNCVWLPIDAKFPQEDYLRLMDAADQADAEAVKSCTNALVRAIKNSAKDIKDKYLNPPHTTDFAILFLPTEGLYAEVLRQPGVVDSIQRDYRIVLTGPTTLLATLSSLRMGFRTLAIEQRSSEVWEVLGAVKTEFGKFEEVLTRLKKQLDTASKTIETTGVRTRAMERKLRSVEQLPTEQALSVLQLADGDWSTEEMSDSDAAAE